MSIQDECICSVQCTKTNQRCTCLYSYDDDTCSCICGPAQVASQYRKMPPDSLVDICIKNADLSIVAEFLSRSCEAELFIPAARARTKISLSIKKAPLHSVISEIGLRMDLPVR